MEKKNIPFSPPDIGEAEIAEVGEAMRSGWITTGPRTKKLENNLKEYCSSAGLVCLNSATAALELNLRMLGIGEGDEVIVPAYTYTASASPIDHVGAKIVFVDSKKDSTDLDYEQVEKAVNERTKAIISVDLGGIIADYDSSFKIAEEKKNIFTPSNEIQQKIGRIAVIADCAHSLGAVRDGKKAGSIADFSSFSFHAVKNFTTAEGGAASWKHTDGIDDGELYHNYQLYSLHGQSKDAFSKNQPGAWEYDIIAPLYKCNMTDITAAIGLKQLERYPGMLKRRKDIIEYYDGRLDKIGVFHLNHYSPSHSSSGHLYITRVPGISHGQRCEIIAEMALRGIACNVHYKPLPMMTAYKNMGFDIKDFPNAYDFYVNEITLPLYTRLTDSEVEYIIDNYTDIVSKYIK